MHTIIVNEKHKNTVLAETILIYGEERGLIFPLEECMVTLDNTVVEYEKVFILIPKCGQKIGLYRLSYDGKKY